MSATRLSGLAAIVLLCTVTAAAGAQSKSRAAPGSTEPVTSAPAPQGAAKPAEDAKPAASPKARAHRVRRCGYRRFYLVPPPRYWFRPLPHYRCYRPRAHRGQHRSWRW
jgi:hypothetical protein